MKMSGMAITSVLTKLKWEFGYRTLAAFLIIANHKRERCSFFHSFAAACCARSYSAASG